MGLMKRFILSDLDEFAANDVRLKVIGNWRALAPDVVALIENALERTSGNKRTTLAVALNYGAQDEPVRAATAPAASGDQQSTRLHSRHQFASRMTFSA